MKRKIKRCLRSVIVPIIACAIIIGDARMLAMASGGVKSFDFDGDAFYAGHESGATLSSVTRATEIVDKAGVPQGYTDGVYGGGCDIYSSVGVDFEQSIDLSKVTSFKIRMYVPNYTYTSQPKIRIFNTPTTADSYTETLYNGTLGEWNEIELIDLLNDPSIRKDSSGYLDSFIFGYRCYANEAVTCYYDSIIITYTDNFFVEGTEDSENSGGIEDPNSTDITLSYCVGDGGSQDDQGRYLMYFTGIKDTSEIYWNNNTVYIDGEKKSGDGIHYAVLDGRLALCLSYEKIEPGVTSAANMGEHILTIKAGTIFGGKYTLKNTISIKLDGYYMTLLETPDVTVELVNSIHNTDSFKGIYFKTSEVDALPFHEDWMTCRYSLTTGGVYVNERLIPTAQLIKIDTDLYYIAFDAYMNGADFGDGTVVRIKGTVTSNGYTVEYTETAFALDIEEGWQIIDYNHPAEDIIVCLDDGPYIVEYQETMIDGVPYEVGTEYRTVGEHNISYTRFGNDYECQLICYSLGEVNGVNEIDISDLIRLKKMVADNMGYSEAQLWGADMNSNEIVDGKDLELLRTVLLQPGVVILSPEQGKRVALASEEVQMLTEEYSHTAYKAGFLSTGEDLYHRDTTILRWKYFEDAESVTVLLGTDESLTNPTSYNSSNGRLDLINLLPNTTYYWAVTDGNVTSAVSTFVTDDTVRTVTIAGASNTRDIGGYQAGEGKRIKYGMVYRGSNIDGIRATGIDQMINGLGIKTDLDLRGVGGTSPLGTTGVNYYSYSAPFYWGETNGLEVEGDYRNALVSAIRTFADESNYPIYVHCAIGRDRTGSLCMLINGLCGVSKEDLYLEYEMSFLSASGSGDGASVQYMVGNNFTIMYNGIQGYAADGTFADACAAYMKTIGISEDEINAIRSLMVENDE